MKYLVTSTYNLSHPVTQYIGNGCYMYQGEKYAVLTNRDDAKRYTSRKRAENAMNKLYESCVNLDTLEIEEVDE